MRKAILTFLVALPLCMAAQTKSATEQRIEAQGFVDIRSIDPSIKVSLMYTRPDNFTGKVLYTDLNKAYLHPLAAEALKKAQTELKKTHPQWSLIVYDATRPMSVQQKMWDVVKGTSKNIYVSNPANGGGLHNYGFAVDVSICNEKGDTIPMGTIIDHLGREAQPKLEEEMLSRGVVSQEALINRRLLRQVMAAGGYKVLSTEWWHFNLKTRKQVKAEGRKVIK